jgi:putative DNA primase/helicase
VGCPAQGIKPLGSFEEWSTLIRQALIWAGEADPCAGRQDIEAESDPQYEALNSLLTAWYGRYGNEPKTVKQVKEDLDAHTVREDGRWFVSPEWRDLHSALSTLDRHGEINVQAIGKALRSWKGRMIGGKRLMSIGQDRTTAKIWRVESA